VLISQEKINFQIWKTKKDMAQSYDLIAQIYENLDFTEFETALDEMIARTKYQILAAFFEGKLVGLSGFWIARMLYCGRYLQASNLAVNKNYRNQGIGKKLLARLEQIAKEQNCQKFMLDSYTENKKSHSLYFESGFYIRGFHFMKDLT